MGDRVAVLLGIRAEPPAVREAGRGGWTARYRSHVRPCGEPSTWPYNTSTGAVINLVRAPPLDQQGEPS